MSSFLTKVKLYLQDIDSKKIIKRIGFFFLGLVALIIVVFGGLRIYFNQNKPKIVSEINTAINDNIAGNVKIGDVGYKFLIGFPNFTVVLNKVELRDSLFPIHKRTLLKAEEIEVRLNVLALLKNEVEISKIVINDAKIDLFKDKNGVSNSNILKPKPKKPKPKSDKTKSIDQIDLNNVVFISENQQKHKLFYFDVASLQSTVDFNDDGWKTDLHIKTLAKSMAFNALKGSFIKGKNVEGVLAVVFSKAENKIKVDTKDLKIGEDLFDIKANFSLEKIKANFDIDIKTEILWTSAYKLLSNNISAKLKSFDLKQPIKVGCTIAGDMNVAGDPEIVVEAFVKDNELKIPDGLITDCNFNAKFTNSYKKDLGTSDANSAIIIKSLTGSYKEIPIVVPIATINNLEKPVASGSLRSDFDVVKMKGIIGEDFIQFYEGTAKVNLDFEVDIVDLRMKKPHFTGAVDIKQAHFIYKPKDLTAKTNIRLDFTEEALFIRDIKYQRDKNIVFIDGRIDNFLNLYYDAPEKMVAVINIKSPFLDMKKMMGTLAYKDKTVVKKTTNSHAAKASPLAALNKAQVVINLKLNKLQYANLTATNAKFVILLNNGQLFIKDGWIETSGGNISFNANLIPQNGGQSFNSAAKITSVDIPRFLTSFKNFGIKSFQPNNIRGNLSATAVMSGKMDQNGELVDDSMKGDLKYEIKNGSLINFEPIVKVGKVAFPNRDVKHIVFNDLSGKIAIHGHKVDVDYFKVSSNVLNFDVMGIYSFKRGTNLGMKIPLRDPKKDFEIKDKAKREALRYKGIVLNLVVVDGDDGKMKIKLGSYDKQKKK